MKSKAWLDGFSEVLEAGVAEGNAILSRAAKAIVDDFLRDEKGFFHNRELILQNIQNGSRLCSRRFTAK